MPDIIGHHLMAAETLVRLDDDIKSKINEEVFFFSANGPDPYFFYFLFIPMLGREIRKRATVMHEAHTGAFLIRMAENCQDNQTFSFLAGFLCHYALDSVAHPYIIKKAGKEKYMHMAIEHKIDLLLLNKGEKTNRNIMSFFEQFPNIPTYRKVLAEIYGWEDNLFRTSYRHMKFWYQIVKDCHCVLNRVLCMLRLKEERLLYSSHICDNLDLKEYQSLEAIAIGDALQFISATYQFIYGEMKISDLQTVIGNRSYSGEKA